VAAEVPRLLDSIQSDMLAAARSRFDACIERATTWEAFMAALDNK
jgi:prolyl-tRNA synthetase